MSGEQLQSVSYREYYEELNVQRFARSPERVVALRTWQLQRTFCPSCGRQSVYRWDFQVGCVECGWSHFQHNADDDPMHEWREVLGFEDIRAAIKLALEGIPVVVLESDDCDEPTKFENRCVSDPAEISQIELRFRDAERE